MTTPMSRRSVLSRGAQLGAAAALTGVAAACTPEGGEPTSSTAPRPSAPVANTEGVLPTYVPFEGITPDGSGAASGAPDMFLKYPASPKAVTDGTPPGKGGPLSGFFYLAGTAPIPADRNEYWQELNRTLGVELDLLYVPSSEAAAKAATLIAAGEVPDIMQFYPGHISKKPEALDAVFQDLTPFLSGDAVKDYPFLANKPTYEWRNTVYNNKVYGVPVGFGNIGGVMIARADILEEMGLPVQIQSGSEFREMCREVTDERNGRWALTFPLGTVAYFLQMFGGPNKWREDGGKFTSDNESEEMKDALAEVRAMQDEGVIDPDGFANTLERSPMFGAGKVVYVQGGVSQLPGMYSSYTDGNPGFRAEPLVLPKYDGGGPSGQHTSNGMYAMTVIRKTDEERVREILAVLNHMSAPFGSAEQRFIEYGIEDVHYTLDGTDPILTTKGEEETHLPVNYIGTHPYTIYFPGNPEQAQAAFDFSTEALAGEVPDPTIGLFSATAESDGAGAQRLLDDVKGDIIMGRKEVADWDEAVADWRKEVGDQIRSEYEAAFEAQQS